MLNELKRELKQKGRLDVLNKKNKIALEQAWFRDRAIQCSKCRRMENLTIDHIIPRDILEDMGIDTARVFDEDNLQVLCAVCNKFKAHKLDFSTPSTKLLLLKYIDKL